jgi:hypothetical protein
MKLHLFSLVVHHVPPYDQVSHGTKGKGKVRNEGIICLIENNVCLPSSLNCVQDAA